MIRIHRTDSTYPDFTDLVRQLDRDLKIRNGEADDFFAQFNKTDLIRHVIVAYADNRPSGCGAIKAYSDDTMEVKRMFVPEAARRQGIASAVLSGLETWAAELGYKACILETGKAMPEAIALYLRSGYSIIPNYGQYEGVESSVCLKKLLK